MCFHNLRNFIVYILRKKKKNLKRDHSLLDKIKEKYEQFVI